MSKTVNTTVAALFVSIRAKQSERERLIFVENSSILHCQSLQSVDITAGMA
jgi:hypothetical protein